MLRSVGTACLMALLILPVMALTTGTTAPAQEAAQTVEAFDRVDFDRWLADFRKEARAEGISKATLDRAFADVTPIAKVLEYDRSQPEFTRSFWNYLDRAISQERVERGRKLLRQHADLLSDIRADYGVQPRYLVAFWGLETNFGDYTGGFPVIGALTTLAYDPRRSEFFRAELMYALKILDGGHIPLSRMLGSWAGAMGQSQFMPSTFARYAVDRDGDGRKDIWGSLPDMFASAANYLSQIGWDDSETWGREVRLPDGFDFELVGLETRKHISEWQDLGVRRANGNDLPIADIEGSIIVPAGASGPAFLVYGNYRAILTWNRSHSYALAVGHLSDRLRGAGGLHAQPPEDDHPIPRQRIIDMQAALNKLGHEAGEPDGIVGSGTRGAIKEFQRSVGLTPDGYPTHALIERILDRAGE